MAHRIPPSLNLAVLCSYVEYDGNNRPFSLVEPLSREQTQPAPCLRLLPAEPSGG